MKNYLVSRWNAVTSFLFLSILSLSSYAQNPLDLDVAGVTKTSKDPVQVAYQIAEIIATFVLVVIGVVFLVVFIKQLISAVNEAREDGRWEKVGGMIIMGILVLVIIVYLISLALSVFS